MAMIAIALVRGISTGVYGTHDQIWSSFWVQLETSISVIMVSTMIFKTLFVVKKDTTVDRNSPRYPARLWKRKPLSQLPDVEVGATMTGMRTMIRENGRTTISSCGKDEPMMIENSEDWRSSNDESTLGDTYRVSGSTIKASSVTHSTA
jgi:hypothetical protein